MICEKCGNQLQDGVKFCTNCGTPVKVEQETTINTNTTIQNNQPVQEKIVENNNISKEQPISNQQINNTQTNTKSNNETIIKVILNSIIKPIANIEDNKDNLSSISNSFILVGIISAMTMIINLVVTVLKTLFTKSQTCFLGYCYGEELSIAEKFKTIEWWPLIWKYIVISAGIILLITCIYYVVALIFKKNLNFSKILGITSLSIVPALLTIVLISPVLELIWVPASSIFSISGILYSTSILFINIEKELGFENKDKFILVNLISIIIIVLIAYLVNNQIISSQISNSISGLGL